MVGAATAGIYFSMYYTIRYLFAGAEVISNTMAYLIAIIFQYKFQSAYTFGDIKKQNYRLVKFALVTFVGYAFSLLVTVYLVPQKCFSELIGLLLVILLLPLVNMIFMFVWVFCVPEHK